MMLGNDEKRLTRPIERTARLPLIGKNRYADVLAVTGGREEFREVRVTPELLMAIITGLLSVVASVGVTTLSNRSELRRIRRELEQSYEKSLFDKRVKIYPKLYQLLSANIKLIRYGEASRDTLLKFREEIDSWNSKYALFFTPATSRLSGRFRTYLFLLLKESEITDDHWIRVKNTLQLFEAALRAEIGILNVPAVGPAPELKDACEQLDHAAATLHTGLGARQRSEEQAEMSRLEPDLRITPASTGRTASPSAR